MKKVFCVVLAVLMLFTMQIPAMAHGENIWESQADFAENSALVKAEDLMGFSFDRTSVTAESVRLAGCEYTEMTDQNDVKITVDQSGNLVRFNSIYAKKTENNMPVREKKNAAVVKENSNVLAFKYNTILRRTNVSGNWRFVFLDGCETAVDTGWAEQFNIYGRSGRAYLGWFDTVQLVYTHQFQDYFWPRVGNKAIQALALDAANSVPGQGTTPIRFWGDTSYTGVVG